MEDREMSPSLVELFSSFNLAATPPIDTLISLLTVSIYYLTTTHTWIILLSFVLSTSTSICSHITSILFTIYIRMSLVHDVTLVLTLFSRMSYTERSYMMQSKGEYYAHWSQSLYDTFSSPKWNLLFTVFSSSNFSQLEHPIINIIVFLSFLLYRRTSNSSQ